jgi:hypothetical protein
MAQKVFMIVGEIEETALEASDEFPATTRKIDTARRRARRPLMDY